MRSSSLSFAVALVFCVILACTQAFLVQAQSASPVCRALALGGGGDLGAFEAGAFAAFVDKLPPAEVQYDLIAGISAGSINAAALSMFKKGDEISARKFIVDKWRTIGKDDVWKNWFPGGIAEGFLFKQGLLDTSPLERFLQTNIDINRLRSSGRVLMVGATNLNTGKYESFDQNSSNVVRSVLASSAIPGIFPPVDIDNKGESTYVDGGLQYMTPVTGTIQKCMELKRKQGFSDGQIQVDLDVFLAISDINFGKFLPTKNINTPMVLLKSLATIYNNIMVQDLQNARIAFPGAKIRVVKPTKFLNSFLLFFNNNEEIMKAGYDDALKVLNGTTVAK